MHKLNGFRKWFQSLDRRGKSLVVIGGALVVILIIEAIR